MGKFVLSLLVFLLCAAATQAQTWSNKYVYYVESSQVWWISSTETPSNTWTSPVAVPSSYPGTGSQLSATRAKDAMHIFYQNGTGNIQTQSSPDAGSTWNTGAVIDLSNTDAIYPTALAATCYPDTSSEMFVYYQDTSNRIRQITSGWTVTPASSFGPSADANSPIAAIAWNPNEIRIYYIYTRLIYEGDWDGSTWRFASIESNTGTYVALASAYMFSGDPLINAYYIDSTDYFLHDYAYYSGTWTLSAPFTSWETSGGISALYGNNTYVYVYLQNADYDICELYCTSGGSCTQEGLSLSVGGPTFIASTVW